MVKKSLQSLRPELKKMVARDATNCYTENEKQVYRILAQEEEKKFFLRETLS